MKKNLTRNVLAVADAGGPAWDGVPCAGGARAGSGCGAAHRCGADERAPRRSTPEKTSQPEQNEDDEYLKSPSVVALGKKLGIGTEHASTVSR